MSSYQNRDTLGMTGSRGSTMTMAQANHKSGAYYLKSGADKFVRHIPPSSGAPGSSHGRGNLKEKNFQYAIA